jgi:MFS family permease
MATHEKNNFGDASPTEHSLADSTVLELPDNWKYKRFTCLGYKLPWFASPPVQLVIVSFVCFMCPGMFNALNGMGGGGQLDPTANNKANTALYSTFAVVGFFAGTFTNKLGIRTALSIGGIGYSVYVASYLSYNHTKNLGFTTFAGALLGVCAGLLWCAQGAIMMSYPPEASKGRYISWFWMIFNMGAVIGSLVCHAPLCATARLHYQPKLLTTLSRSPWDRISTPRKPLQLLTALMLVFWFSHLSELHFLGHLSMRGMSSEKTDRRSS